MTTEERAQEISESFYRPETGYNDEELYMAAMAMAKWKDERVKSCFILISKLIKDGLLKKDNPEHIMVEQMIELYNNLKI